MTGQVTNGQAVAGGVVAPNRRDLGTLEATLHDWLQARMPQARGLRTDNFAYPKGAGLSHETILFDAHWTEDGASRSKGLVIRIKPMVDTVYPQDWFVEQYRVMEALANTGTTPVATPLWLEMDPGIVGAPFFVMEKRVGKVPVSFPPYSREGWVVDLAPPQRRRLWENAIGAFASLQSLPVADLSFLDTEGRHPDGAGQEWDRWRAYDEWARAGAIFPLLDEAWARLARTMPARHHPGLVWGDARIGNMMFDDAQNVIAVMDWEAPGIGGGLHDLGYWCVMSRIATEQQGVPLLEGMGTRAETIALWGDLTGIETADIDWYEQFAALKASLFGVRMFGRTTPERPGMNRVDSPATRVLAKLLDLPPPPTGMPEPRPGAPTA